MQNSSSPLDSKVVINMTEQYRVIEVKVNDKQKEVLVLRAQIQDAIKYLKVVEGGDGN